MRIAFTLLISFISLTSFSAERVRALKPKYTSKMTVAGYTGESTLTNFPVAVRISPSTIEGFSYDQCKGQDDISFSDANGMTLPYEIESWNTGGESLAWVSIPEVTTNTPTTFTMNWKHSVEPQLNSTSVWINADYKGVWHMNEYDASELKQSDSTGNGFTVNYKASSRASGIADSSLVGKTFYRKFDKITAEVCATTPNLSSAMKMNWDGCVLSGWAYYATYGASGQKNFFWVNTSSTGSYYWGITTQSYVLRSKFGTKSGETLGTGLSPEKGWFHWAIRIKNKTLRQYFLNGVLVQEKTMDAKYATLSTTSEWTCGGVTGYIGEVRYQNVAASDDWIKAEYDSVKNPDFILAAPAVRRPDALQFIIR